MKYFKYLLLFFILSFMFISKTNALYGNMISDSDRNIMTNNGVNKKWEINSANRTNVLNTPYVDSSLKIYDYSNVLSNYEIDTIKKQIDDFIKKHKMELIIVTVDLPYSYDSYNETVAADFYDYNDFGIEYKYYDGIVLFRNTYSSNPYFDIYTFGNAQLYFDQERYDEVLDGIYNDLHYNNYIEGFTSFINYCDKFIDKGIPYRYSNATIGSRNELIVKMPIPTQIVMILIITSVVYVIWLIINLKKCKMVIKATNANDYLIKNSIKYSLKEDRFINSHTTSYRISSSSGGGGSFGSSGGGHSSGGGRHG